MRNASSDHRARRASRDSDRVQEAQEAVRRGDIQRYIELRAGYDKPFGVWARWAANFGDPVCRAALPVEHEWLEWAHEESFNNVGDGRARWPERGHRPKRGRNPSWPLTLYQIRSRAGTWKKPEGWSLFESGEHGLEIERDDDDTDFKYDDDAQQFVFDRACEGSVLHLSALLWVRLYHYLFSVDSIQTLRVLYSDVATAETLQSLYPDGGPAEHARLAEQAELLRPSPVIYYDEIYSSRFGRTFQPALTSYGLMLEHLKNDKIGTGVAPEAYLVERFFWNAVLESAPPYTAAQAGALRRENGWW